MLVDNFDQVVKVVDRFAAAVVITASGELVTVSSGRVLRVPAESRLLSGNEDGTLLGPDKKKVNSAPCATGVTPAYMIPD